MKKFFLVTVGIGAIVVSIPSFAADLARRAPAPYTKAPSAVVATVYDWSGFYAGLNAGGGSSRNCWGLVQNAGVAVNAAANREGCNSAGGAAVGGQIGYRYQMANWVFGVEAQGDWANFSGSNRNQLLTTLNDRSRVNGFGLFTGQVGYAVNNVLAYVKGGAAVVGDKYDTTTIATGALVDSAKSTRWGGTVGAGLEYGFSPNWTVGVEYDHIFLGNKNLNFATAAGTTMTHNISQDADIGLLRVNYKFGPGFMR
jgi:outer membrane immunogenic protein